MYAAPLLLNHPWPFLGSPMTVPWSVWELMLWLKGKVKGNENLIKIEQVPFEQASKALLRWSAWDMRVFFWG